MKKRLTNTDIQKRAMITALEKSLGIVTTACKSVGISRQTHYEWLRTDEDYKKEVDDIENIALDFGESQLFVGMKEKNMTAVIFYLKTKGKKRGYVERQEFEVIDNDIDFSNISDEDLQNFINQKK